MRAMKDSGIEWIGEIPEEWKISKIGCLFKTIGSGTTPSSSDGIYYDGEYNWLQTGDLNDGRIFSTDKTITELAVKKYSVLRQYSIGSLVVAMYGATIGKLGLLHIPCYTNQACCVLSEPLNMNVQFVYYWLLCNRQNLIAYSNGGGQPNINQDIIKRFSICLPPIEEQNSIAIYLIDKCSKIDTLIAAKEKTNALLKERRQSIIYEAVTKGLDPTVPMKDSGVEWIGEIPEGWGICRIKHIVDKSHPYPIGDGDHGMIKAEDYQDEGIPYVRVLNLSWGMGMDSNNLVYISEEMNDRIKNSELRPNDILIAKTGATIGKTAIVPPSMPLSNTTSHVGKITISSEYNAKYFFYVMTSFVVQKQIIDLSSMQSTRPELGIDGLKNLIVTFPPLQDQQRISRYLDCHCADIDSMINSTEKTIKVLKEYRQSLIYEAVTGKIEV